MAKVISFTSNPKKFTVYLDNGEQKTFRTDDPKTQHIVAEVIEASRMNRVVNFNIHNDTFQIYRQVETKTKGLVKFYRMAKSLFGGETKPEVTLELIATHSLPDEEPYNEDTQTVVAVVEPADKPVSSVKTQGAKIAQAEAPTIVAGAESLKRQIAHAATDKGNTEALTNFMRRFATVAKERQHSAEDLLAFFEKHDMPITINGDIVAYKRLRKTPESYVDSYSGKVTQWVGSYVFMDADMVNPDRNVECSNGLNVARRSYLGSFSGDTIVIVLIAPEDVIAVPRDYNRAKMRGKGYHIVLEVSEEGFKHLVADTSVTQNQRESMILKDIIEGKHVPIMSRVHIGGPMGTNLTISGSQRHHHHAEPKVTEAGIQSLEDAARPAEEIRKENSPANIRAATEAPQIDPLVDDAELRDVANFHDQVVANGGTNEGMGGPVKPASECDLLLMDYNTAPNGNTKVDAARALVAFKKAKKKGWDKLGIEQKVADAILADAQMTAYPVPVKASPKPKAGTKEKKAKASKPKAKAKTTKAKSKAPAKPATKPTKAAPKPAAKAAPKVATSSIEMTDDQKLAKAHWAKVQAGTMSKAELAKACNTSPRSLTRWAEKFNF